MQVSNPLRYGSQGLLAISAILATIFGFGLSIVSPHVLSSSAYVQFGLILGYSQVVTSICFEWCRLASLRYSFGSNEQEVRCRRQILVTSYVIIASILVFSACILAFSYAIHLIPTIASAAATVAIFAALQGISDGVLAFFRASRKDLAFSISLILRASLGLCAFVGVAVATGDAYAALMALGVSYVLAVVLPRRLISRELVNFRLPVAQLKMLAAYGLTASLGSIIAIATPSVVRSAVVAANGLASAAGVVFALDLSHKAIASVGMIVSMLLTQNLYRAAEKNESTGFRTQAREHIAAVFSILAPALVGFLAIQGEIGRILVPGQLQVTYLENIVELSIAAGVVYLRIFAIDPIFHALGRPGLPTCISLVNLAALIGLGISAAAIFPSGPQLILHLYLGCSVAALAFAIGYLLATRVFHMPWRDIIVVFICCAPIALIGYISHPTSVAGIIAKVFVCGSSFATVMVALNGCDWGQAARQIIRMVSR